MSLAVATIALVFQGCNKQPKPQAEYEDTYTAIPKKVVVAKPLPAKLTLSNFSVNKPLLFRPFNKFSSAKKIYFSFIGQTTGFIDIKSKIKSNLRRMGYRISADKNKSDLYVG